MPTIEELDNSMMNIKENKSPGSDGSLQIEFYKTLWHLLKTCYMSIIIELQENTKKNFRPLSLTNCDYKIISCIFADKLQTIMPSPIRYMHVVSTKDRYIRSVEYHFLLIVLKDLVKF